MIQLYPDPDLRERIVAFRTAHSLTTAQLLWAAVTETRGALSTYLAPPQLPPAAQMDSDDIFAAFPITTVGKGSRTRQLGVRLDPRQIEAIDRLVSASPAAHRSAYLCAALTCYMDRIGEIRG